MKVGDQCWLVIPKDFETWALTIEIRLNNTMVIVEELGVGLSTSMTRIRSVGLPSASWCTYPNFLIRDCSGRKE